MKWYIGQDIVCIKTHSENTIKKGDVFVINALKQACCKILIDVGLKSSSKESYCTFCFQSKNTNGIAWIGESLFAPLDSLTDISEIEELLKIPLKIRVC